MEKVTATSGNIVAEYAYDGTGRRVEELSNFTGSTPGTVQDDYYAGQQVIESDVTAGGVRAGGYQYVWSQRYIDSPILRDTLTTDGSAFVAADRVFYLSDANHNVTGLVDNTGAVAERYVYSPYGVVTYCDINWIRWALPRTPTRSFTRARASTRQPASTITGPGTTMRGWKGSSTRTRPRRTRTCIAIAETPRRPRSIQLGHGPWSHRGQGRCQCGLEGRVYVDGRDPQSRQLARLELPLAKGKRHPDDRFHGVLADQLHDKR